MADLKAATAIAEKVYPPGDQVVPHGDFGLILNNEKGEPVGYVVLDVGRRWFNDIAVLPEYRRSAASVLMRAALEKVAQTGGEWQAEARASTGYKVLRNLARKKILRFTSDEEKPQISRYMGSGPDAEPFYKVKFKSWEPETREMPDPRAATE
jgi:hypothetical protein